jgi:hypothetical protein
MIGSVLQTFGLSNQRTRWAGHVARMGEASTVYRVMVRNLKVRDHLEGIVLHGRIILKWMLNKFCRAWIGIMWRSMRTVVSYERR